MRNQIREVARRVGIAKKMGWHTFRHTCATLLRASGADIKVVQELLRHASCRVTLDTYTQAVTEQKRAGQNKIAGLVRGLTPQNHRMPRAHRHSGALKLITSLLRFEAAKEVKRTGKSCAFCACEVSAKLIVNR
jgi:hypothetical protein